jgi:integrase
MRKEITELALKKLEAGERMTDTRIKGFVARCLPSGEITFGYVYTNKKTGARKYITIGLHGNVTVARARELAAEYSGEVAGRADPAADLERDRERAANTVDRVLDKYLENRERENARSVVAIRGNLAKHVRPTLGSKVIYDLERDAIMRLLDRIGEDHRRMPGIIYAYLRAAFNFWMLRDSKFKSPIIKGMVKEKTKMRNRVLAPDEIRDIWRALDELEHVPETFAAFVKVLFLTACRRCEVSDMHTDEIMGDRWTIPASRYKTGNDLVVPLIPAVKKLLPKTEGYVFGCASHRHHMAAGDKPLNGFDKPKAELDAAIAEIRRREHRKPMAPWTYHDLRRTARTMLAELGVDSEIAERVLGHSRGKIEETYNAHKYLKEKAEALTKLANHVDRITRSTAPAPKLRLVAGR